MGGEEKREGAYVGGWWVAGEEKGDVRKGG